MSCYGELSRSELAIASWPWRVVIDSSHTQIGDDKITGLELNKKKKKKIRAKKIIGYYCHTVPRKMTWTSLGNHKNEAGRKGVFALPYLLASQKKVG